MLSPAIRIGGVVFCCLVILAVVLGVYFSGVGCPDFGSECTSSPAPAPVATGTPPAGTPPAGTPPAGTPPAGTPPPPPPAPYTGTGTTSQSFGGGGGGDYAMNCPSGKIVKNISGRGGWWVDQLNGNCNDGTVLTAVGGQGGGPVNTTDCPTGYTGINVEYGAFVGKVTPKCAGAPISTSIGSAQGEGGGQSGSFDCPSGQVITGISGKAGSYVDSMKVTCK